MDETIPAHVAAVKNIRNAVFNDSVRPGSGIDVPLSASSAVRRSLFPLRGARSAISSISYALLEAENMSDEPPSPAKQALGDFAPKIVEHTDQILFGDIWERPQLSKRDRSLITCAALVATGKVDQMDFHFPKALENGVTRDELIELITHMAFYAGWPSAMSAMRRARELLEAKEA